VSDEAVFNIWLSGNLGMRRSPRAGSPEIITCGFRAQLTRGKIVDLMSAATPDFNQAMLI
jgi:hypothetical protein